MEANHLYFSIGCGFRTCVHACYFTDGVQLTKEVSKELCRDVSAKNVSDPLNLKIARNKAYLHDNGYSIIIKGIPLPTWSG